jgi:hypothetical protein
MANPLRSKTAEGRRLGEAAKGVAWRRWGPYLSERQWGTVREDYSDSGDAWNALPHDHARSRAYRWGEDGIGGWSDDRQLLCLALALWNGRDPILKERLFGLTNSEGNHGEDVKEVYYFLDGTPTHSWMRMLYKYPQREFPYAQLVECNRGRSKGEPEFELIDTGIFDDDRYWDVEIAYGKAAPEDTLLRITAHNRGPDAAVLTLVPQLWFRNTWSWHADASKPVLRADGPGRIRVDHPELGSWLLTADGEPRLAFCENETNVRRLYGVDRAGPFKDGTNDLVVGGDEGAVKPKSGTKAAVIYRATVQPGEAATIRLRLSPDAEHPGFDGFDAICEQRRAEADEFYAILQQTIDDPDARNIQRQALAGMLWSKQVYLYDIRRWLAGDPAQPTPPVQRLGQRNSDWKHFNAADVLSMPDTWEYPWFAAWDLAFHCIALATIDPDFAKRQLRVLTKDWYMHPNGQLPAYEWAFGDVNPPVHAWSAWRVFQEDRRQRGDDGDLEFLERVFIKLLLNFTWWTNRKDVRGNNIFQGGFLGLDNIGVFDRSAPLPTGGYLEQADGTAWMGMYCINMLRIALELAVHDQGYEEIATKFFEHFLLIAEAIDQLGGSGLWDEEDGFFYDWLHLTDGGETHRIPLKVRSMVGLVPLFAVGVLDPRLLERLPRFRGRLEWFLEHRPELARLVSSYHLGNHADRRLLAIVEGDRLRAILERMFDEEEFLAPYGVRALSRVHRDQPYRFHWDGRSYAVAYKPGESDSWLFGGNSNWRGPIWMPVNYLLVEALHKYYHYYGDGFRIEVPRGSGRQLTLLEAAEALSGRLVSLFTRDGHGRRPVYGGSQKQQSDPQFKDHLLFYEYFHGDNGAGIGASHQTGWTGLVAKLIHPRSAPDPGHLASSGERD